MDSFEKNYIWISYAPEDRELVEPIATRMRADGFRVRWEQPAGDGLSECGYCIVFLSGNYLAAEECVKTLFRTRELETQHLLIYLDDVTLPRGMAMRMGRNQAIFYTRYPDTEAFLEKVYEAQNICRFSERGLQPQQEKKTAGHTNLQKSIRKRRTVWLALGCLLAALGVGLWWTQKSAQADAPSCDDGAAAVMEDDRLEVCVTDFTQILTRTVMELQLTNKTQKALILSAEEVFVNFAQSALSWGEYLPAGETVRTQIVWELAELQENGIDLEQITAVEFTLCSQLADNIDDISRMSIAYYPLGEAAVDTAVYVPAAEETVLADTADYYVAIRQHQYESTAGNWILDLVLVNRTQTACDVSVDGETVNGYAWDSEWSKRVRAGSISFSRIRFEAEDWKYFGSDRVLAYSGQLNLDQRSYPFTLYPHTEAEAAALTPYAVEPEQTVFQNEAVRISYLGPRCLADGEAPGEVFLVQNLLQHSQTVELYMEPADGSEGSLRLSVTLPALQQTVAAGKLRNECSEPLEARLEVTCWNRQFGADETVENIALRLGSLP